MQGSKKTPKKASSAQSTTLSQGVLNTTLDATVADEDEARRQAEVTVTTALVEQFEQHAPLWEAIEVGPFMPALAACMLQDDQLQST